MTLLAFPKVFTVSFTGNVLHASGVHKNLYGSLSGRKKIDSPPKIEEKSEVGVWVGILIVNSIKRLAHKLRKNYYALFCTHSF